MPLKAVYKSVLVEKLNRITLDEKLAQPYCLHERQTFWRQNTTTCGRPSGKHVRSRLNLCLAATTKNQQIPALIYYKHTMNKHIHIHTYKTLAKLQ